MLQVWFRVNELLPPGLKKSLPDRPPEMQSADTREGEGISCKILTLVIII